MNKLGEKSRDELEGVHPDLIIVTTSALLEPGLWIEKAGNEAAYSEWLDLDWAVHDGIREIEDQRELMAKGASWTMDSMHLIQEDTGYGHAVDLVPYIGGRLSWDSIVAFKVIGLCMKGAAAHHGIPITWGANKRHGGDWKSRNDMAHFELEQSVYM